MAEMTAAEAVRTAWKFNQPGLVRFIECQESKAKLMSQQIEHCTALIERQAAEIERLNKSLQYEQHRTGRQGTHAEGCYKWGPGHWDCAMQEIERLRDLHRSILWFVEEHKKIPNCKKWMPLIGEKARRGVEKEAEVKP